MLTITRQSDYALLFISYLKGKKDYLSLSEMVKKTNLPQRFLARIAATLVKNKIVASREGKIGGYKLIADLNKLTLYDFLNIFEKNVAICKCAMDTRHSCQYEGICEHHHFLNHELNNVVIQELKRVKLGRLFKKD